MSSPANAQASLDIISFLSSDPMASGTPEMYCEMDDCVGNASLRCPACKLAMCMSCHSVHTHPEVKEDAADAGKKAVAGSVRKEPVERKKQQGKLSPSAEEKKQPRSVFEPYWDLSRVEADLQAGRLKKGVIEVPESKKDQATFRAADGTVLQIVGWEHRNRSLDGDTVAIQFQPNDDSRVVYNFTPFTGREFTGKLALNVNLDNPMVAFSCSDIRFPPILCTLPASCIELLKTQMVRPTFKLKATKWEASSKWPLGEPASEEELDKAIREKIKQEKAKLGGKVPLAPAGSTPLVRKTFKPHVSEEELKAGLESGEFIEGMLRIVSPRDAFVIIKGLDVDVYLEGRKARNRAYDGDRVAIRIAPKSEWRIITEEKRVPHSRRGTFDGEEGRFDFPEEFHPARALASDGTPQPQPTGSVVYILHRPIDPVKVGYLDVSTAPDKVALFKPLDLKAPFAVLPKREWPKEFQNVQAGGAAKHFYVARFNQWKAEDPQPLCSLVGPEIGHPGTPEAETRVMLTECNINYDQDGNFSPEVLAEAQQLLSLNLTHAQYPDRVDFRNKKLFTIDVTDANDVETGFTLESNNDNTVTVGVHAVDVSYFVKKDSKIDAEARFRGCTVSLVQKNLPMLPRAVCENFCSLNPGKDRLAFSVMFRLGRDGKLVQGEKPQFRRSVVRSCCKLDHKTAQLIIDHAPATEEGLPDELKEPLFGVMRPEGERVIDLINDVLLLHELGIARRKARFSVEGALSLKHIKINFQLDAHQQPIAFEPHVHSASHAAVEELKILANRFVAEQLLLKAPDVALLLRQGPPDKLRLDKVVQILHSMGVGLQTGSAGLMQASLNHFSNSHYRGSNVKAALEKLCLAPMQHSEYFCPGQLAQERINAQHAVQAFAKISEVAPPESKLNEKPIEEEYRHFSKNLNAYTHFTSPLRRYADLEVQRLLAWSLDPSNPPLPYDVKTAAEITAHCNFRYDWAKKAQELSSRIFLSIHLHHKHPQGWEEKGMIVEIASRSFKVLVFRLGLEHRIQLDEVECREVKITNEKILEIRHIDGTLEARQVFDEVQMLLYGSIEPPCQIQFRVKPRQPITALNPRGMPFSPRPVMLPSGSSSGAFPPGFSPRNMASPRGLPNSPTGLPGMPSIPSPRLSAGRQRSMPRVPPTLTTEHSGDGTAPPFPRQRSTEGRGSHSNTKTPNNRGHPMGSPRGDDAQGIAKPVGMGSPRGQEVKANKASPGNAQGEETKGAKPSLVSPKGELGSPNNAGKGGKARTPLGGNRSLGSPVNAAPKNVTSTSTSSVPAPISVPAPTSTSASTTTPTPTQTSTPNTQQNASKKSAKAGTKAGGEKPKSAPANNDQANKKKPGKEKANVKPATNNMDTFPPAPLAVRNLSDGSRPEGKTPVAIARTPSSTVLSATSAVFSPSAISHTATPRNVTASTPVEKTPKNVNAATAKGTEKTPRTSSEKAPKNVNGGASAAEKGTSAGTSEVPKSGNAASAEKSGSVGASGAEASKNNVAEKGGSATASSEASKNLNAGTSGAEKSAPGGTPASESKGASAAPAEKSASSGTAVTKAEKTPKNANAATSTGKGAKAEKTPKGVSAGTTEKSASAEQTAKGEKTAKNAGKGAKTPGADEKQPKNVNAGTSEKSASLATSAIEPEKSSKNDNAGATAAEKSTSAGTKSTDVGTTAEKSAAPVTQTPEAEKVSKDVNAGTSLEAETESKIVSAGATAQKTQPNQSAIKKAAKPKEKGAETLVQSSEPTATPTSATSQKVPTPKGEEKPAAVKSTPQEETPKAATKSTKAAQKPKDKAQTQAKSGTSLDKSIVEQGSGEKETLDTASKASPQTPIEKPTETKASTETPAVSEKPLTENVGAEEKSLTSPAEKTEKPKGKASKTPKATAAKTPKSTEANQAAENQNEAPEKVPETPLGKAVAEASSKAVAAAEKAAAEAVEKVAAATREADMRANEASERVAVAERESQKAVAEASEKAAAETKSAEKAAAKRMAAASVVAEEKAAVAEKTAVERGALETREAERVAEKATAEVQSDNAAPEKAQLEEPTLEKAESSGNSALTAPLTKTAKKKAKKEARAAEVASQPTSGAQPSTTSQEQPSAISQAQLSVNEASANASQGKSPRKATNQGKSK